MWLSLLVLSEGNSIAEAENWKQNSCSAMPAILSLHSLRKSNKMEQEVAKRLFQEGAALVLLDVPPKTEFGIDYNSWNVGKKFKGVKMIPPGFHFVYYSSVSREGQTGPRTGFFHFFHRREVLVLRWDGKTEDLTSEGVTTDMAERIQAGLRELDSGLGAYPYDSLKKWTSLTSYIQEPLVRRVEPLCGKVSSVSHVATEDEGQPSTSQAMDETSPSEDTCTIAGGHFAGVGDFPEVARSPHKSPRLTQDLPFRADPNFSLRFSKIPTKKYPPGASPSDITRYSLDHSYVLQSMLQDAYHARHTELLGELQLSFVTFLIGQVFDAFEWWKAMVVTLCSSDEALGVQKELFSCFISTLHFQLQEVPADFFVDIVSKDNFLTVSLQTFFSNLEQSTMANKTLVKRGLQFRDNLIKKFNWDFSQEGGEFAPTVVEEDECAPTVVGEDECAPTVVGEDECAPTVVEQDTQRPT